MKYLFFDVETSGFFNKQKKAKDPTQAWICQLACQVLDEDFKNLNGMNAYIRSEGRSIHPKAFESHGLTTEFLDANGMEEETAINLFCSLIQDIDDDFIVIAHNVEFDLLFTCYYMNVHDHITLSRALFNMPRFCTMKGTTDICKLPGRYESSYKWPTLGELYKICTETEMVDAHNAMADVNAMIKCFKCLVDVGLINTKDIIRGM